LLFNNFKTIKNFSTVKYRLTKNIKRNLIHRDLKVRKVPTSLLIFIPYTLKIMILKSLKLSLYNFYVYNEYIKFSFHLPLNYFLVNFDLETNTVIVKAITNSSFIKQYANLLTNVCSSFFKVNFKKLKFKGKGYYIYKNKRNTIAPQFGYSHRLYIYSWFTGLKFSSKTTLLLFGLIEEDLQKVALNLKSFRKINVFTGRGVRFSRQCVYSKPGKVSTYR
jgi:ribosomal protein L6P/L9E